MIFPSDKIKDHLNDLGLLSSDTVMIHGDAGVAGQYKFKNSTDHLSSFILDLLRYFCNGTIIVPTFTYSGTKNEVFDVDKTPSEVGQFSESFRRIKGVYRSNHPIFSVSCYGKHDKYYINSSTSDCFGKDTFFDKIYLNNVKLLTLGCELNRITFSHYIEQKLNVSYRYFKYFKSNILEYNAKNIKEVSVRYFVRDLDFDTSLDLSTLEKRAIQSNKLVKKPFGRFLARVISAGDFFDEASELIKKNEYALIKDTKI